MNKSTSTIIKIAAAVAAVAAVVVLAVVYKDKILAFIDSVKEKVNAKREQLPAADEASDFADM